MIQNLLFHFVVKIFSVVIEETSQTMKTLGDIKGQVTLQITHANLLLVSGTQTVASWPFNCIRRYKCHSGIFLVEVGRKAPTGEGLYRFFTNQGDEIFDVLAKAVNQRMSRKQGSEVVNDVPRTFSPNGSHESDPALKSPVRNAAKPILSPGESFDDQVNSASSPVKNVYVPSSSKPPPVAPRPKTPSPNTPLTPASVADSYSHLTFSYDPDTQLRARAASDNSYDHLRSETSTFEKRRPSDKDVYKANKKALNILGLAKQMSVEDLTEIGISVDPKEVDPGSTDDYSHLDFPNNPAVKRAEKSVENSGYEKPVTDNGVTQQGNMYNRLHEAGEVPQEENVYDTLDTDRATERPSVLQHGNKVMTEQNNSTYHHLGSPEWTPSTSASNNEAIYENSYDALNFKPSAGPAKPLMPTENRFMQRQNSIGNLTENIYDSPGPPSPVVTKATSPVCNNNKGEPAPKKPVPAKRPIPQKPPRTSAKDKEREPIKEVTQKDDNSSVKGKHTGEESPLISMLKKNLEIKGFSPMQPGQGVPLKKPPASPPTQRQPVTPLYAVSPFGGERQPVTSPFGGEREHVTSPFGGERQHVTSPFGGERQPFTPLYAVSPFGGGRFMGNSGSGPIPATASTEYAEPAALHPDQSYYTVGCTIGQKPGEYANQSSAGEYQNQIGMAEHANQNSVGEYANQSVIADGYSQVGDTFVPDDNDCLYSFVRGEQRFVYS